MEAAENREMQLIAGIKNSIKAAQYRALLHVNERLIMLYWDIGNEQQAHAVCGNKFIDTLAREIKFSFPDAKGFSVRNLRYMKRFAAEITDHNFLQTVSAKLPWSHNLALLEKLKSMESRYWYGAKAIENGWSLAVLEHQIAAGLMGREQGRKLENYDRLFSKISLPEPQSELVIQTMEDSYIFDFVALAEKLRNPKRKMK